jgi:probable addiction module antidote protein
MNDTPKKTLSITRKPANTGKNLRWSKMATVPYSSSDYLKTDEDIVDYLDAAMEDGDSRVLLLALRNAAIAKGGIAKLAEITGLNRESLYKTLSEQGNPQYDTVAAIVHGLGFRFSIQRDSSDLQAA